MPRSTRKQKKKKSSKLKPAPEVFVLSPQILHKLGINISNIETPTSASCSNIISAEDDLFKKPRTTRKSNKTVDYKIVEESSVMTTASLMKESVLLSPSFLHPGECQESIANIEVSSSFVTLQGNIQTAHNVAKTDNGPKSCNYDQEKDQSKLNSLLSDPTVTLKKDFTVISKENYTCGNELNQQSSLIPEPISSSYSFSQSHRDLQNQIQKSIKENEIFELQKDVRTSMKKPNIEEEDRLISLNDLNIDDDHLDEAYSSDCSNGNNTTSPVSAEFNLGTTNIENISKHKINILSEEVIDDSRLNEMIRKSLSPSYKDMIPVAVDTVMSLKQNAVKANSIDLIEKIDLNLQNQLQPGNVSVEQVSMADDSFLDNIITGVIKMDEIDINILEVSDADLNAQNTSNFDNNNIIMMLPEDYSERQKINISSDMISGAQEHDSTKLIPDYLENSLKSDNHVQEANTQNLSKVSMEENPEFESSSDIFIEFIDKYSEFKESTLSKVSMNEYDCAKISQIQANLNASHAQISNPNPPIGNTIKTSDNIKLLDIDTKDNNSSEKEQIQLSKQQAYSLDNATQSVIVGEEPEVCVVIPTPNKPVTEKKPDTICHCKCNMQNAKKVNDVNIAKNGKDDKLNEIANYLKMFVDNKRKKSQANYLKTVTSNISSQAVLKPKSCVHGIEKPGGSNEDAISYENDYTLACDSDKAPRTYQRKKNIFKIVKLQPSTISNSIMSDEKDINTPNCNIAETGQDCFCLCYDYGSSDFYDFEITTYNHIHYLDNVTIDFDIFEWFSERDYVEYIETNLNDTKSFSNITDANENILNPICWVGWDHMKTSKNAFFNEIDSIDHNMPKNEKIKDLLNDALEVSKRKDLSAISVRNECTNMVNENNEINHLSPKVEAADDADDDYAVIYQVIEYLPDKLEAGPPTDTNKDIVKEKKRKLSEKSVTKNSSNFENKDEKIRTYKSSAKVCTVAEPDKKLQDEVDQGGIKKKTRNRKESNRKASKNINKDITKPNNMRESKRKASSDISELDPNKTKSLERSDISLRTDLSSELNSDKLESVVRMYKRASKSESQAEGLKPMRKSNKKEITKPEQENETNLFESASYTKTKQCQDINEQLKPREFKITSKVGHSSKSIDLNSPVKLNTSRRSNRKSSIDIENKYKKDDLKIVKRTENPKKVSIEVDPVFKLEMATTIAIASNEPQHELQILKQLSLKKRKDITPEHASDKDGVSRRSKRRVSGDIELESKSKTIATPEIITNSKADPDLQSDKLKTKRQTQSARNDNKPKIDPNSKVTRRSQRQVSGDIELESSSKTSSKPEINTSSKNEGDRQSDKLKTKRKSRNSRNDSETNVDAELKVSQISERQAIGDIKQGTNSKPTTKPETITSSKAEADRQSDKLKTKRKSRNSRNDSGTNVDTELKVSRISERQAIGDIKLETNSKPTTKPETITSSKAEADRQSDKLKTKRKTRNSRNDSEPKVNAELKVSQRSEGQANEDIRLETNSKPTTEPETITSSKDEADRQSDKLKTNRKSRNSRNYTKPKVYAELKVSQRLEGQAIGDIKLETNSKPSTTLETITSSKAEKQLSDNSSTKTQSRNARNDSEPKVDAELKVTRRSQTESSGDIKPDSKSKSSAKPETITNSKDEKDLQREKFKTKRQSRNATNEVEPKVDAELDKREETDRKANNTKTTVVTHRPSYSISSDNVRKGPSEAKKKKATNSKSSDRESDVTSNTDVMTTNEEVGNHEEISHVAALVSEKGNNRKRKRSKTRIHVSNQSSTEATSSNLDNSNTKRGPELDHLTLPSEKNCYETECGVCDSTVEEEWIHHIYAKHFYLAWKKGDPVLDLKNPKAVEGHLKSIVAVTKTLTCSRCSYKHKSPKMFLDHIENCDKSDDDDTALSALQSKKSKKAKMCKVVGSKTCGVCSKTVRVDQWESHAITEHYNLTWAAGDPPIDLKDPNAICRQLSTYKSYGGIFKCNLCDLTRSSAMGFYAHVLVCGKSPEEIAEYMETCDQCKKSYLCINRQPHMAWHTKQQQIKEAKELALKKEEERIDEIEKIENETDGRKRKAAKKAISMIKKQKSVNENSFACNRCDFTGSTNQELKSHKCADTGSFDDQDDVSEDSLEFASDQSDDESSDGGDLVSDSSAEDTVARRHRARKELYTKYARIPFEISSETAETYVRKASKSFIEHYFCYDTLFDKWRNTEYTVLQGREIEEYTPPVAESCKYATADKWTTLKRFKSVKQPMIALFAGGCPSSICWVPGSLSTRNSERHYLAVATHLGTDAPRYSSLSRYTKPGTVLQIWDFDHSPNTIKPKLVMCIAMDKGTVWNMSWCPSGARDSVDGENSRLGLVAVACSDGNAYVYSVPHPVDNSDKGEPVFVKLKPVAELRLHYNAEKQICQSSKVFWSMQKGHEVIAVGFSNGMVAFYDLCAESPLTRMSEGGRDIFYPFSCQQAHRSAITGLSLYPRRDSEVSEGLWAAGSAEGGVLAGAGTANVRHCFAAVADTNFLPLWPAAIMASDEAYTSELEFGGVVRKFSASMATAGCLHCTELVQYSSPLLRSMRTHPVFTNMRRKPLLFIQMRQLKRTPESKDCPNKKHESAPSDFPTYEKAIEEFGVRIKYCRKTERLSHEKEFHPGRFPLSEVVAMAFCPTLRYHHWLAVATHSGLVFFIDTS